MKNFNLIETRRELRKNTKKCQVATRSQKDQSLYGEGTVPVWQRLTNHQLISNLSLTIDRTFTRYAAMILAVLVMSIANIGMAWGEDITITPTYNNRYATMPYGLVNVTGTVNANSSGVYSASSNGGTYTLTFTTTKSDMYIKSVTFNTVSNGTLSSSDGTITSSVFTASGSKTSVTITMTSNSGKKGSCKITNVVVNAGSNTVETHTAFSVSSSTVSSTAKIDGSSVTSAVSMTTTGSASDGNLSIPNNGTITFTSSSNILYIAFFNPDNKILQSNQFQVNSTKLATGAWSGSAKTVEVSNKTGATRDISHIWVITEAAAAKDYTVTATVSGGVGGTVSAAASSLDATETTTITATPASGYQVTNWAVSGTGASVSPSGASNSNTTTLTMGTADATVTVTFGLIDYAVTKTLTNCAVKDGSTAIPSTMNYGDDLSTIIEPTSGNLLPSSITVSGVTSYTWNALTGALTLTDVTGAVSISISAGSPQTGSGATVTYAMVNSGSTAATYSTGVFTGILSGGSSNKNTLVASNTLSGGNGVGVQSNKTTPSNSYTAGITSSTSAFDAASTPYVQFSFDVVDGYTFTPTGISVPVQPISNAAYFKILVTDGSSTWTTTSSSCASGSLTTITTAPTGGSALTGTVYVRVYCYSQENSATGYRFGTPITVTGTVAAAAPACSDDTGLAYGETTVNKVYGDASFTNTLTNSNSLSVTYSSSNTNVATVNESTGAVTIAGAGTTTITASWAGNATYCEDAVSYTLNVKPAVGSVSGAWDRFGGETISLSVTPSGGSSYTYQWQKYNGSGWDNVSNGTVSGATTTGATEANLQIANCGGGNSGTYRCSVTSASQTNETVGYGVKVYVLESYDEGTTVYNFTRDGNNQRGSVTIDLDASTAYKFKVHADNDYYGNNGTVDEDITNWVLCNNDNEYCNPNLTVNAGLGGTFTFTMDYSASGASSVVGEPELSITYPRKRIYLSPGVWDADGAKFAYYYFRDGGSTAWTDFLTRDDCGNYADIPQWNGVKVIAGRINGELDAPAFGDGKCWNQTNNITITSNDYIEITGWNASDYTYNSTYSMPTYTISYAKGSPSASISGSKSNETKTCGVDFTLPSSAVFTREGYLQTGWTTSDGGSQTHALGGTYTTNDGQAFYPVWTVQSYNLTWDLAGGTTTSAGTGIASDVSVNTTTLQNYGTSLTAPTVTKDNYDFSAWSPSVAKTMPAAATTYTATWTAQTHDVSFSLTDAAYSSGTDEGEDVATYGTNYSVTFAATSGYSFPSDITVQIGGVTKTKGTHYTWNASTGALVVTGSYITGDIAISFAAIEDALHVTYDGDSPTSGSAPEDDNSYDVDVEVTVLGDNSMSKTGYTFRGWSDGTTFFLPGQKFTITDNVTLTAVWEPNSLPATTLFSTDFSAAAWSGITSICSGKNAEDEVHNGITFHSYNGDNAGKPFAVDNSNGTLTWCANNMGNNYWIAIPVTGVNGSITITVDNGSTATRFNYATKQETSVSGSPGSGTSSTSADPSTVTISNLTKSDYVVYLGRQGTGNTTLTSITITTPGTPSHFDVAFKDGETAPESHTRWPSDIEGVEDGLKILAPADPTAANYTFDDWYTSANCTTKVYYSTMTISADTKIYAKWYAHTRITTQPATSVDGIINEAYTIGTGMVAVGENLEYQWYTCDEKGENLDDIDGKTSSTMTDTKTSAGSYYYKVKVHGDYGDDVYSDMITVTVVDPCFRFSCSSQSSSVSAISSGDAITTSSWESGKAKLTGGTMKNSSSGSLNVNKTYGLVMESGKEVTVTLAAGRALDVGSVITLNAGVSDASGSQTSGLVVNGNTCTPASYTSSTEGAAFTQTYTVTALDGLAGTNTFTIAMKSDLTKTYLNGITVTGCAACTPIDPELTAGTTTLYLEPTITSTTLTLDKDGSTGSVDWSVSPSGVVSITGSGTEVTITAVAAGSATVKATIGSDGTHCGKTVTKDFTVAACGIMEIAGATVASATSGILTGTTAIVTGLSSNKLNTNGTSMFGLILPSSANHFQVGDSILFNLKVGDWYQGAKVSSMCVYVSAGKAASKLNIYTSASIASGTSTTIRFAVTQAMIDAGLVDSVIVFRDGTTTQNHVMSSVSVKRYACSDGLAKFTGDGADANWSTAENWANGKVPTIDDRAIVEKPIEVNIAHAVAKEVILYQNSTNTGSLSIQANKGLELVGKVQVWDGSTLSATGEADLVLESSTAGNASLIFENAGNEATVMQYSKASIVGNTWNWQYVGTPFTGSIPQYNYYGSWMYKWNNGWEVVHGSDELTPFAGYCLTQNSATTHVMGGTLVPTTSKSVTMAASTDMVLANSWTAPIWIGGFTEETFTSAPATIYLFNTGSATKESGGSHEYDENEDDSEAGTYVTVPVNSAPYTGNEFIASMQGFFVTTNGGSAGTITMNYNDLVRPSGVHTGIVAGPMKAPKRAQAADDKPAVLKMWANGSEYNDRVVILERADFSEGFDNGWDGKKMSFGVASPSVYVINAQGGYDAVSAIPDLEGTVVGFRAGADNNCTITFSYEGDDIWYLNDLQAQKSTLISEQNSYAFTTSANDSEVRFIISATPIQKVATGVENGELLNGANGVRKVLINDHIYIIRSGRIYSVDGVLVK